MKRIIFLITLFIVLTGLVQAKNLQALFSYSTFYSPETGPFVETYLSVAGNTVEFQKNEKGTYNGKIEVIITLKENNVIKKFSKYNLISPDAADKENVTVNFIDQQRFALPNGNYLLEISISDINGANIPFTSAQELTLNYTSDKISVSDIELVDSYTPAAEGSVISKSGFDLIPYVTNFYPSNVEKLIFYAEIYHTSIFLQKEAFLTRYYISNYESKKIIENYSAFSRHEGKEVIPILGEFPIEKLPTGNYLLTIEARDKQNELLAAKEIFFQRSNTLYAGKPMLDNENADVSNTFVTQYTDAEVLRDMVSSLRPKSNAVEANYIDTQLANADLPGMQRFFYHFWEKRNQLNPARAWAEYKEEVDKVNSAYGTRIERGYETDRGRVYLQYGPPNNITRQEREPSAYPYEIWHYYILGNQSNRKFVFYNPDLVTNDYALIHSDALGEINDPRWQMKLQKRSHQNRDLDVEKSPDHFGGRSDEIYNLPR
jgi:GWxTD domain-containing protein